MWRPIGDHYDWKKKPADKRRSANDYVVIGICFHPLHSNRSPDCHLEIAVIGFVSG